MTDYLSLTYTTQTIKFSIMDFFSKCDQIHRKLRIWSHLLKKSLMENFIFCVVVHDILIWISDHNLNVVCTFNLYHVPGTQSFSFSVNSFTYFLIFIFLFFLSSLMFKWYFIWNNGSKSSSMERSSRSQMFFKEGVGKFY